MTTDANCIVSTFDIPGQGSIPKKALVAGIKHFVCPTHALATRVTDCAALHVPILNAPHCPEGVPKEANTTLLNVYPLGAVRVAVELSLTEPHTLPTVVSVGR